MDPYPLNELWFRALMGIVIGLILGSFTTMLSYRIPRRLSIIHPPSQCPNCHAPLTVRDLVPVLSWILEKGQCRHCKKPISLRYVLIELVTALAVLTAFICFGITPPLIPALFAIIAFITLVTINIERRNEG